MSFNLFRAKAAYPATAPGVRIYAIGDIHGRYDLLIGLFREIEAHQRSLPPVPSTCLIFLGDFVDRGAQSAQVVELLRRLGRNYRNIICLAGNHEDVMLRALQHDPVAMRAWLRMGGDATLQSYGIVTEDRSDADLVEVARREVPADHVAWLAGLPTSTRSGGYFFCHAGIRPGVSLRRQNRADMLWIRDDFLDDTRRHECVIVHGHSIEDEVQMRTNRIGIDTGAYRTGVLSAICLEGTDRKIIAAGTL